MKLRPYQDDASRLHDMDLVSHGSTLIVQPTGTGKTVVMADIVRRWSHRCSVMLLAHRVELLDQAAAKFSPMLGYTPEVIQADRVVDWPSFDAGRRVLVGSVQTVRRERVLRELRTRPIGLLLIDEAHHSCAKTYRKVLDFLRSVNPDCKCSGVTATPKRGDKKALGIVFDSVAYEMTSYDAIDSGWLVPPAEERVIIDGVDWSKCRLRSNEFGESDFDPSDLEVLLVEEEPLQAVAKPLIDAMERGSRSWIVFAAGVKHARLIARILNRHKGGCAASIDGENHPPGHPERESILRRFQAGELQFLCNCGIATEGFDAPVCAGVAIAKPTKSLSGLLQMAGRALRPLPGIVDGTDDADARKRAIAASEKPQAMILYYIPAAANIPVAHFADALGGNFDDKLIATAKAELASKPGAQVVREVQKAKALHALLEEEEGRKRLIAQVSYRREAVGSGTAACDQDVSDIRRGGASDAQIKLLVGLGVAYATAAAYSAKQASAVISKIGAERCTSRQRAILAKYGFPPDVSMGEARRIIDEIARSGWTLRGEAVA